MEVVFDVAYPNFDDGLAALAAALKTGAYVALSIETTALRTREAHNLPRGASLQARYGEARRTLGDVGVVQLGVCVFRNTDDTHVAAAPFNFMCWPQPLPGFPDREFKMQSSRIRHMTYAGFDFTSLFEHGLNYCNAAEARVVQGVLDAPDKSALDNASFAARGRLARTLASIAAWRRARDSNTMLLRGLTTYDQHLLREHFKTHEPDLQLTVRAEPDGSKASVVTCFPNALADGTRRKAKLCRGAALALHAVLQSGLPVAVHSGFYELLILYRAMIDELPETPCEMAAKLRLLFRGGLYDTHVLYRGGRPGNHKLVNAYAHMGAEACVENPSLGGARRAHNAVYSAFMTGALYFRLVLTMGARSRDMMNNVSLPGNKVLWVLRAAEQGDGAAAKGAAKAAAKGAAKAPAQGAAAKAPAKGAAKGAASLPPAMRSPQCARAAGRGGRIMRPSGRYAVRPLHSDNFVYVPPPVRGFCNRRPPLHNHSPIFYNNHSPRWGGAGE